MTFLRRHELEGHPQEPKAPWSLEALVELLGGTEFDVVAGIDVSTSTPAQGDNPLTGTVNQITTAGISKACTLPSCTPGRLCVVFNSTLSTVSVYPTVGVDLGLGANNAASLGSNSWLAFLGITTSLWGGASGVMV